LQELARGEKDTPAPRASFFTWLHRRAYYSLLAALERKVYSNKKIFLAAVSQRTAGLLKEYFHREDVRVIPNGVDAEHFTPAARLERREQARRRRGFADAEFVLLLIGNDWRVKGLPTVLEAMAAIPGSPLRLLVVGDDNAHPFQVRARKFGIEQRCLWERAQPDVLDFYAAADVYVSPSLEDSFGLPVAEAMACGLPAITSIDAGVAAQIHDGVDGFVLPEPRDARTLADQIERIRTDLELRRRISEAAARTSLEWTWNRNAAAVWDFLKMIEADRSAGS
ncbi:MAG: glycosyltransferase family 4 protein, partial [Candidatus Acidiferrum sp.]